MNFIHIYIYMCTYLCISPFYVNKYFDSIVFEDLSMYITFIYIDNIYIINISYVYMYTFIS